MHKLALLLILLAAPAAAEIYPIERLDLERYRGKVVYLDFWASWCKPCRQSFPWMNGLMKKYPAERFTIVTINLDQESEAMHYFLSKVPADFDIYHDPSGRLAEQFKLEAMPTSFLLDTGGKVVAKHIGFYTAKTDKYERAIEELL